MCVCVAIERYQKSSREFHRRNVYSDFSHMFIKESIYNFYTIAHTHTHLLQTAIELMSRVHWWAPLCPFFLSCAFVVAEMDLFLECG